MPRKGAAPLLPMKTGHPNLVGFLTLAAIGAAFVWAVNSGRLNLQQVFWSKPERVTSTLIAVAVFLLGAMLMARSKTGVKVLPLLLVALLLSGAWYNRGTIKRQVDGKPTCQAGYAANADGVCVRHR